MRRWLTITFALLILALPALAAEDIILSPASEPVTLTVQSSGLEQTVVRLDLNRLHVDQLVIEGRDYVRLDLGRQARHQVRGFPDLPTVRESLRIPDDAAMQLRILDVQWREYPGYDALPSKGSLTRDIDPATVPYVFGSCYTEDSWYPSQTAALHEPYIFRDTRGLVLELNPVQYNPARHLLRVAVTLTVEVSAAGPGQVNVLTHRPSVRVAEFEELYARHYLNYTATADKYPSVPEVGSLLVVTYDAFHAQVQPLVDWKNQMGVATTIVDMSAVGATATDLKNYIQNLYDTTDLAFVLLVGDAVQVPPLTYSGSAADPLYALVAGGDSYPDILVGRLSAENASQAATQVARSIAYERDPQPGADWYHKACGIASAEGSPSDKDRMDQIRDILLGFTFTEVDRIYDPGATAAQVTAALNEGRSLVNYLGHGGPTSWGTTGYNNANVNALTNVDMLPWVISVACNTGEFDDYTCFAEAWMRATHDGQATGAIGVYASTISMSWDPPVSAQFEIAELLVAEAKRTLGALCFNGACQMIDDWGSTGVNEYRYWTVFGDPSLRVRTDTPAPLAVSHDDVVVPMLPSFTVITEPGALAALSDAGVLIGAAFADAAGEAVIPLDGPLPQTGTVLLTVTGFNRLTHMEDVPVGDLLQPTCDVSPAAFYKTLVPDQTVSDWLHISNSGEEGSTLYYSLELRDPDYPTKDLPGDRNMTGSWAAADTTAYLPGATMDIVFSFHCGSTDDEWLQRVELEFPPGVVVNSATDIYQGGTPRIPYTGAIGDGVTAVWYSGGYYDVIFGGDTGTATVSLTFDDVTGDVTVPFLLQGDNWGGAPHQITGTIVFTMLGPSVSLQAPNGGELWGVGEMRTIEFAAVGGPRDVCIELDRGLGDGWELLVNRIPASERSWLWKVTKPISAHCRMRVCDQLDPAVADSSDGEFTIYRPLTWIALGADRGDVPQGETDDIEVIFNSIHLPPDGTRYAAEIVVSSTAGDPVVIPVAMIVDLGLSGAGQLPEIVRLDDNHPNPFNPRTTISFHLPQEGQAVLAIYGVDGRRLRTLLDASLPAGDHMVLWDGRDDAGHALASGVYFYRLETTDRALSKKMLLLK
jgi:hypothetical protein